MPSTTLYSVEFFICYFHILIAQMNCIYDAQKFLSRILDFVLSQSTVVTKVEILMIVDIRKK